MHKMFQRTGFYTFRLHIELKTLAGCKTRFAYIQARANAKKKVPKYVLTFVLEYGFFASKPFFCKKMKTSRRL